MNTKLHVTKILVIFAFASLAFMVATVSVVSARARIPGTRLPDGTIYTGGGGGGGLPPEDLYHMRQPLITNLVDRTENSLTLRLMDRSSYEVGYELYRGLSSTGPWTLVASWPSPWVSSDPDDPTVTLDYTDTGLNPDTRYSYRFRAYNGYGESAFANDYVTLDGRDVWRLQLRVRTADVEDAGTDDDVYVALNGRNTTWLNYSHNDFERGSEFTYDLLLDGVSDLSDINGMAIENTGSDGLCIESLAFLVNGSEIFNQQFGATSSTCQWLDQGSGNQPSFIISRAAMRAHPVWQGFQQPAPPLGLPRAELESRIEGIVGDALHGTDAYWGDLDGDRYVELAGIDAERIHVTVDLSADVPGFDAEVDLSFDLRFAGACSDGQNPLELHIMTENVQANADLDWYTELATLGLANLAEGGIADRVVDAFPDLNKTITIATDETVCVTPVVFQSGDVLFTVTRSKKAGGTKTTGTVTGGTITTGTGTVGSRITGTVGTTPTKTLAK
jgi:PLAT/LH2 domain-containing protein